MVDFSDYISNAIPISFLELGAAIFGTLYLRRIAAQKSAKLFVAFLWFTFFFEIFASYAPLTYFFKLDLFKFTIGTPFEMNYWAYNIYFLISYFVYITYVKWQLTVIWQRKLVNLLLVLFLTTSIANLFTSQVFFEAFSAFTNITGTLALLVVIGLYYYQLVRSDEVLKIGWLLPFYITIGAVILHLCLTPFLIYSAYFKSIMHPDFTDTYLVVLGITNLIVYSIYILGFIVCRKKSFHY